MGIRSKIRKLLKRKRYPKFADRILESRQSFSSETTDVRAVCFYLPQFHQTPENDLWWGEGFTEWTNVRKAGPSYPGHEQPRMPHPDIGEYDLTDITAWKQQVALAKDFGIYGFCFYFYYFNGKTILEKPIDLFLENSELDIKFCLCWANGHWIRSWEGKHNEFLMEQNHSPEDDIEFISHISRYFRDPRYIRYGGRPLLLVFETKLFPDPAETAERWRVWCRENGVGEICLATVAESGNFIDPVSIGFDLLVEFPPHPVAPYSRLNSSSSEFRGEIYDYSALVRSVCRGQSRIDSFSSPNYLRCAMLHWDNTARRELDAHVWENFSFEQYSEWMRCLVDDARARLSEEKRYIFINAWNEWAEGTYLEPDNFHGYRALNTTARVLFDIEV